ncbi:hypothetical protein [Methanoculleus chikugoensis]|uniref:hypothetical protein n=1 Tax=Methanoculleus chikugoensis TaxID=118126 RepID=UPI0006D182C9|nr:hypothetical protein [Methanoculleus chikugoensis]
MTLCCPGHGRSIPVEAMPGGLLDRLETDAARLSAVGAFDRARLADSLEHAADLLQEANRIFSAIAGRLYALAYRLDDLAKPRRPGATWISWRPTGSTGSWPISRSLPTIFMPGRNSRSSSSSRPSRLSSGSRRISRATGSTTSSTPRSFAAPTVSSPIL